MEQPPLKTGHAGSPDDAGLRGRVTQSLRRTWTSLEECVERARGTPEAPALHEARIAAKKARYLIELIEGLNAPGSREALACLRRLQQHLGDWHDLEVLEEMMLEMVARKAFLAERLDLAIEVERLVLWNRRKKLDYVTQFVRMTGGSEEWLATQCWVRDFLTAGEKLPELEEVEDSQSPPLAMPRG
jgi:CHAD domain-containing protein